MTTTIINLLPYLLIGLGIGYLVTFGVTRGASELDHARDDLAAKKEWLRMLGEKNVRKQ